MYRATDVFQLKLDVLLHSRDPCGRELNTAFRERPGLNYEQLSPV